MARRRNRRSSESRHAPLARGRVYRDESYYFHTYTPHEDEDYYRQTRRTLDDEEAYLTNTAHTFDGVTPGRPPKKLFEDGGLLEERDRLNKIRKCERGRSARRAAFFMSRHSGGAKRLRKQRNHTSCRRV